VEVGERWLTSVMISMKRQKAKKIPKSILTMDLLMREGVVDATRLGGEVDDDGWPITRKV
jgi:hypothetical protein